MKTLLIALFLITVVSAPSAFSGEASPKSTTSIDKKPPHGDDGTGGNGGGGTLPLILDR
jgi:hypothetical protein